MFHSYDFVIMNGILLRYTGNESTVVVPEGVSSVGAWAFSGKDALVSLTLPVGVQSIGYSAFEDCTSLAHVSIPGSVVSIESHAFHNCKNLSAVKLPEGLQFLGDRVFWECTALRQIELPDSLRQIGLDAFSHITSKDPNQCVSYIGSHMIKTGYSDPADYVIPEGTRSIAAGVFAYSSTLTSITIPEGVRSIGPQTFYCCDKLKSVSLPEGVSYIGEAAFCDCSRLKSIRLPGTLTQIDDHAFSCCTSLKDITIPEGVVSIGDSAFAGCESLKTVSLPYSLADFGSEVFCDCNAIASMRIAIDPMLSVKESVMKQTALLLSMELKHSDRFFSPKEILAPDCLISCLDRSLLKHALFMGFLRQPSATRDEEVRQAYWDYALKQKKQVLPEIFRKDVPEALRVFAENNKITKSNFDSDYLTPAQTAGAKKCVNFLLNWKETQLSSRSSGKTPTPKAPADPYDLKAMKKLWRFTLEEDGSATITGYKGTDTVVHIPPRMGEIPVSAIGEFAFSKTGSEAVKQVYTHITSIIIPESVSSIGRGAFKNCKSLVHVHIPHSVASIGGVAFEGCSALEHITLPEALTHISFSMFADCTGLKDITLPSRVQTIENHAFFSCQNLKTINLSPNLTEIEHSAFSYCKSLKSITLPESLVAIGESAFWSCEKLNSITIPQSVEVIGAYAFDDCGHFNFRIFGVSGSTAQHYAKAAQIPFSTL